MWIEEAIQSVNGAFLDSFNIKISLLGESDFFLIPYLIIFYLIGRKEAIQDGCIFYFSCASSMILKELFRVPRAFGQLNIRLVGGKEASGFSFPSSHVQNIATIGTLVSEKLNKKIWKVGVWIVVLLVAYSRIYLGAHTIWDVTGGILFGLCIAHFIPILFQKVSGQIKVYVLMAYILVLLVYLVLFSSQRLNYFVGICFIMVLGYIIETKFLLSIQMERLASKIIAGVISWFLLTRLAPILENAFENSWTNCLIRGILMGGALAIGLPLLNIALILFCKKILRIKL